MIIRADKGYYVECGLCRAHYERHDLEFDLAYDMRYN